MAWELSKRWINDPLAVVLLEELVSKYTKSRKGADELSNIILMTTEPRRFSASKNKMAETLEKKAKRLRAEAKQEDSLL